MRKFINFRPIFRILLWGGEPHHFWSQMADFIANKVFCLR